MKKSLRDSIYKWRRNNAEKYREYQKKYHRKWREKNKEKLVEYKKEYAKTYKRPNYSAYMMNHTKSSPLAFHKYKVRQKTCNLITGGKLKRQLCEVCGEEKVDAHHEDYNLPDKIKWLCREHHRKLHEVLAN